MVREIFIINNTDANTTGRPRKKSQWIIKASFLQSLLSLSEHLLADQLIDRLLSYQRLVSINQ
jgi:hypothetical protein